MQNPEQLGNPNRPSLFGFNLLFINLSQFFSWSTWLEGFSFSFFQKNKENIAFTTSRPLRLVLPSLDIPWLPCKSSPPQPPGSTPSPGRKDMRSSVSTLTSTSNCPSPGPTPTPALGLISLLAFAAFPASGHPSGRLPYTLVPPRLGLASFCPEESLLPSPLFPSVSHLPDGSLTQTCRGTGVHYMANRHPQYCLGAVRISDYRSHGPPHPDPLLSVLRLWLFLLTWTTYHCTCLFGYKTACPSAFSLNCSMEHPLFPLSLLVPTSTLSRFGSASFPVPPYYIQFPLCPVMFGVLGYISKHSFIIWFS